MTHTWIVDVSRLDSAAPAFRQSATSEPLAWTPASDALPHAGASASEVSAFHVLLRHESPGGRPTDLPDQPFPVAGVELPETRFPWIHEPSASLPPPPPARHVRYRRGRWQAWMSNPSASRGYGWSPLPTPLSHQLDEAVRPCPQIPSTILESPFVPTDPVLAECAHAAAADGPSRCREQLDLAALRRIWDRLPRAADDRLGLGSPATFSVAPSSSKPPPLVGRPHDTARGRRQLGTALAAHYRALHSLWQRPATTDAAPTPVASVAPATVPVANDADLALTPQTAQPTIHALYFRNVRLMRHARKRGRVAEQYEVGCAVGDFARSLSDTGAGPSIATTGFLEAIPRDAVISRDRQASVVPLASADGSHLRTEGTVTITFNLDGTPCRHTFIVVAGKPLLLFGNDFLGPRRAVIRMNQSDEGTGVVELHSESIHGRTIMHTARVTNCPRSASEATVSPVTPDSDATSTDGIPVAAAPVASASAESTGSSAPPPFTSVPLPAADLSAEALKDGTWKVESSEHLL